MIVVVVVVDSLCLLGFVVCHHENLLIVAKNVGVRERGYGFGRTCVVLEGADDEE